MKTLLVLIVKEFRQIRRDVSGILLAFVLPVVLILLFGFCINLDSSVTPLALVAEDESIPAHRFIEKLSGSPNISLTRTDDFSEAMKQLRAGTVQGIVCVPEDFSRDALSGNAPEIRLVTDGSVPNTAQFTRMYLQKIYSGFVGEFFGKTARINPQISFLYNPAAVSRYFSVPGSIAIVLTFVGTFLTAMVVAREWERGTIEMLLASPMTRVQFIFSKLVPYFVLGTGSMLVCTFCATQIFGVPLRAPLLVLFGTAGLFLLSVLALGLLISTLVRNQYSASLISMVVALLPTMLLSGFIFELESTPAWVESLSYLVPARYFNRCLLPLFLSGEYTFPLVLNVCLLAASALFWLTLVFIFTPKRLDA